MLRRDPSRFAKTPPQHSTNTILLLFLFILLLLFLLLPHLMLQISFWYLSGSLRQPLGASGSLREAFSKVLASVPGSPIPLRRLTVLNIFFVFVVGTLSGTPNSRQSRISDDVDPFNALYKLLVPFWKPPAAIGSFREPPGTLF